MSNLFFRGHLGLGDHIVCNGLFRVLHEKHDKSIIPVKRHNRHSVERMFQDLSNVVVVPVINDFEADVDMEDMEGMEDILHLVTTLLRWGTMVKDL